jgi:VanZ family protein
LAIGIVFFWKKVYTKGENKRSGKRIMKRLLWWIPAVCMMIIIYHFSSQGAEKSTEVSMGVTETAIAQVAQVAAPQLTEAEQTEVVISLEPYVRKLAHFTEYAILGMLLALALRRAHGITGWRWFFMSLLLAAAYAGTDEFHQLFVSGRAGRIFDVGIDSSGALCGLLVLSGIWCLLGRLGPAEWRRHGN